MTIDPKREKTLFLFHLIWHNIPRLLTGYSIYVLVTLELVSCRL